VVKTFDSTQFVWFSVYFFFSSRRRHTRFDCDWSSDVCSSDLGAVVQKRPQLQAEKPVSVNVFVRFPIGQEVSPPERRGSLPAVRSEERRVGKECRSRWWTDH